MNTDEIRNGATGKASKDLIWHKARLIESLNEIDCLREEKARRSKIIIDLHEEIETAFVVYAEQAIDSVEEVSDEHKRDTRLARAMRHS